MDMGQNEQSYRGPSIDASYRVSDHLAKRTWPQQATLVSDWLILKILLF
jgi:hypothetical protein